MKKILVYLSPDRNSPVFDSVVAYDSGVDVIIPHTQVRIKDVRDAVYGCIYTRHPSKLHNTAMFIGGTDIDLAEDLMQEVKNTFFEISPRLRVSVAVDPAGAYTTASTAVVKLKKQLKDLSNLKATVLAGTGAVGARVAVLLAQEKSDVAITSRDKEKATKVSRRLKHRFSVDIEPKEAGNKEKTLESIENADLVVAAGPEGVEILPEDIWKKTSAEVLMDLNAVPPFGIGGLRREDEVFEKHGKTIFPALAIGKDKIKTHHKLIEKLFETKDQIFTLSKVYDLAKKTQE